MERWRLLIDKTTNPYRHFAVEEAVMRSIDEDRSPNTLRIRMVEPCVFLGFYQHPEEDTDVGYCKSRGIKIIRRMNPGGAVYQDEGTFCYSAMFKKSFLQNRNIQNTDELYSVFGNAVINTLSLYHVRAQLSPVNDITVNQKKIYGSAQLDWYSAFVHSGSFLINVDKDELEKTLKPSMMKFADKGFSNVRERVVNLSELVNEPVDIAAFQQNFIEEVKKTLNVDLHQEGLSDYEKQLSSELYQDKYSRPEWTFSEKRSHTQVFATKINSGVLTFSIDIQYGTIRNIKISGDFLIANTQNIIQLEEALKNHTLPKSTFIVNQFELPADIREGIIKLLKNIQI